MASSAITRVAAPTAATAIITTALAIVVNLATGSEPSPWLWGTVAALTVISFAGSMWLHRRQNLIPATEPARGVVLAAVEGVNLDVGTVRSEGTGVDVANSRFTGDLKFGDITAGQNPPSTP